MTHEFVHESVIDAPAATVFAFHERPDALKLLIPPGEPIRVVEHTGGIRNGARVVLKMGIWPLYQTWVARHQGYIDGVQFQDVQDQGPFHSWEHTHTVIPISENSCRLRDRIVYELPFGPLGELANKFVSSRLSKTFAYRHQVTKLHTE